MKVNKLKLDALVFGQVGLVASCPCCDYRGWWPVSRSHTVFAQSTGYVCSKCGVVVKIAVMIKGQRKWVTTEVIPREGEQVPAG